MQVKMVILTKRWFECLGKLTWEKFFEIFGRRAKQPAPFFYNSMFFRCAQSIIHKGRKISKAIFHAFLSYLNERNIWLNSSRLSTRSWHGSEPFLLKLITTK